MANKLRGEATIEAEGGTYVLRLDFNTFCAIEDQTGLGIDELGPALGNKPTANMLRAVFWGCLQKHHAGMSLADAGELLSDLGQDGIRDALQSLFKSAMPASDPQNGPNPPARARAGTGKR